MNEKIYRKDVEDVMSLTGLSFEESLEAFYLFGEKVKSYSTISDGKTFAKLFKKEKKSAINFKKEKDYELLEMVIYHRFHNFKINKNNVIKLNPYSNISIKINRSIARCMHLVNQYNRRLNECIELHFKFQSEGKNTYLETSLEILNYYGAININALLRKGINTIGEYINIPDNKLLEIRNLGVTGIVSINESLKRFKEYYNIS